MNGEDSVRYGHIHAWQQELGIPIDTMAERLKDIEGIDGRLIDGKVLLKGFYSEEQIKKLFADYLN